MTIYLQLMSKGWTQANYIGTILIYFMFGSVGVQGPISGSAT